MEGRKYDDVQRRRGFWAVDDGEYERGLPVAKAAERIGDRLVPAGALLQPSCRTRTTSSGRSFRASSSEWRRSGAWLGRIWYQDDFGFDLLGPHDVLSDP